MDSALFGSVSCIVSKKIVVEPYSLNRYWSGVCLNYFITVKSFVVSALFFSNLQKHREKQSIAD